VHVYVTAVAGDADLLVYRLGWYGGVGARLVTAHVATPTRRQGPCSQAVPGPSVCDWHRTDSFIVDSTWTPGVYVVRFADSSGNARVYPFVVRSAPADFIVVLPFNTYEAYNAWGGANLYQGPGTPPYDHRAAHVAFARPFMSSEVDTHFFKLDYNLIRWLEQNGYNVSYITDYDLDIGRGVSDEVVAWLVAGHSEYWTWRMRARAEDARAHGVNLAFLGGNDVYWNSRYDNAPLDGRQVPILTCYKQLDGDPLSGVSGLATVKFRDPPNSRPENALIGIMTPSPSHNVVGGAADLVVHDASNALFAGTGLYTGEHLPGLAGWEGDRIIDNGSTPAGLQVLFQSPFVPVGGTDTTGLLQATIFAASPSGALVFASGEPGFEWTLSAYRPYTGRPEIQRFLKNVMAAFSQRRAAPSSRAEKPSTP
jgi:hypothetical protein